MEHTWQTLLNQLNAEYKDLGLENPPVEVFGTLNGNRYQIVNIYHEDGVICLDIKVADTP